VFAVNTTGSEPLQASRPKFKTVNGMVMVTPVQFSEYATDRPNKLNVKPPSISISKT